MLEKQLLYHTTTHAPDMQPVFIAFNVEVFNALFVSSCMRNTTSISVTIALMASDFVGACAALYGLGNILLRVDELGAKMGTEATRARMVDIAALITKHYHVDNVGAENNGHCDRNNMSAVTPWIDEDTCDVGEDRSMDLTDSDLSTVSDCNSTIDPPRSRSKIAWEQKILSMKQNAVAPAETTAFRRGPSTEEMTSSANFTQMIKYLTFEERQQFVRETCRVLRRVEFLLLVEYTEVMVPIVYAIYIATVYHLPNRKFFPYLNEMSETDLTYTIRSVLIYGSLQLLSFILLLGELNRRFCLAPGAILRFVLHNEWRLVQGQFVLWIIYVLQSSIQHVGTDYTFKFKWLHKTE
ncbi:Hypothetical protein PHPALM_37583 [Phytophthora palmivora]|uniref:Transmembrane protein n=1 Tax=Phytophthora palmivora TaxID=4796 RepID=A0A2P4WX29_9STRA|nr:Hypothetical protein PHPALM_37583 [Phytophthora palmivora]